MKSLILVNSAVTKVILTTLNVQFNTLFFSILNQE